MLTNQLIALLENAEKAQTEDAVNQLSANHAGERASIKKKYNSQIDAARAKVTSIEAKLKSGHDAAQSIHLDKPTIAGDDIVDEELSSDSFEALETQAIASTGLFLGAVKEFKDAEEKRLRAEAKAKQTVHDERMRKLAIRVGIFSVLLLATLLAVLTYYYRPRIIAPETGRLVFMDTKRLAVVDSTEGIMYQDSVPDDAEMILTRNHLIIYEADDGLYALPWLSDDIEAAQIIDEDIYELDDSWGIGRYITFDREIATPEINIYDTFTGEFLNYPVTEQARDLRWSNEQAMLVYSTGGRRSGHILNLTTLETFNIDLPPDKGFNQPPRFSPDGQSVVYATYDSDTEEYSIYVYSIATDASQLLRIHPASTNTTFRWDISGEYVVAQIVTGNFRRRNVAIISVETLDVVDEDTIDIDGVYYDNSIYYSPPNPLERGRLSEDEENCQLDYLNSEYGETIGYAFSPDLPILADLFPSSIFNNYGRCIREAFRVTELP